MIFAWKSVLRCIFFPGNNYCPMLYYICICISWQSGQDHRWMVPTLLAHPLLVVPIDSLLLPPSLLLKCAGLWQKSDESPYIAMTQCRGGDWSNSEPSWMGHAGWFQQHWHNVARQCPFLLRGKRYFNMMPKPESLQCQLHNYPLHGCQGIN